MTGIDTETSSKRIESTGRGLVNVEMKFDCQAMREYKIKNTTVISPTPVPVGRGTETFIRHQTELHKAWHNGIGDGRFGSPACEINAELKPPTQPK